MRTEEQIKSQLNISTLKIPYTKKNPEWHAGYKKGFIEALEWVLEKRNVK